MCLIPPWAESDLAWVARRSLAGAWPLAGTLADAQYAASGSTVRDVGQYCAWRRAVRRVAWGSIGHGIANTYRSVMALSATA
eukprot:323435-Rhodomonas_salina.1